MRPGTYITVLLTTALLALLGALGTAVLADPAHIFRTPAAYGEIARLLHEGVPVGELDSPRHRLINRALIATLEWPPETVVLGSSRVQPFSPAAAGWPGSLNLAIEGGDLDDHLYVYSLLRERALLPGRIVLTVDPFIFEPGRALLSGTGDQASTRSVVAELGAACLEAGASWHGLDWLPQVLTLDYFIQSVLTLKAQWRGEGGQVSYTADPDEASVGFVKRPDGSVRFSQEIEGRTPAFVDDYAETVLDHPIGAHLKFSTLDSCRTSVFHAFLDLLERDGVDVALVLLPYHPVAFRLLDANAPALKLAEAFVRDLGEERSIPVFGSYDPATMACSNGEFLDAHHPRPGCTTRILQAAHAGGG